SPQTIALWARVLEATPGSRLLINSRGLADAATADYVRSTLSAHDLPMDSVDLMGHPAGTVEHLALYNRIDVVLDTFPCNGTTTTCDALSMGVAVGTLAGPSHASRISASVLTAAGMGNGVARSGDEYVRLATDLAAAGVRPAWQRQDARKWVAASALCDEAGFVGKLESAYRTMWKQWCAA
ncbi:MAG: hypothetical protein ABIP55_11080, partial [Tepidisphaeraceae bacterium]